MAHEATKRLFFSSSFYAVAGASKDETKWGTKVLEWYITRDFKVTPIHPKEHVLQGINTVPNLAALPSPKHTSISIITPPPITLNLLREAHRLSIPYLWLQPGAEDDAVYTFIRENGMTDKVILGGPCILVEGDEARRDTPEEKGKKSAI